MSTVKAAQGLIVSAAFAAAVTTRAPVHVVGGCAVPLDPRPYPIPCLAADGSRLVDVAEVLELPGWASAHGVPLLPRSTDRLPTCAECVASLLTWIPLAGAHGAGERAVFGWSTLGAWAIAEGSTRGAWALDGAAVARVRTRVGRDYLRAQICAALARRERAAIVGRRVSNPLDLQRI